MSARYEVFKDKADEWRWKLIAANGEPVAASESYSTKADAERGAQDAHTAAMQASTPSIDVKLQKVRKANG